MPFAKTRSILFLSPEDVDYLNEIVKSRSCSLAAVQRARIMLSYSRGISVSTISREENVSRPTVERCIDKALSLGICAALTDLKRAGRPSTITDDAKAWVVSLACQKPTDFGYAAERWTLDQLAKYIQSHAAEEYHCLTKVNKTGVKRILDEQPIKPHKNNYYLEKKDPEFESKMAQVLQVYREIHFSNDQSQEIKDSRKNTTLSYDEKPGIQAIAGITADLAPVPGKYATWGRDYEYKRLGTLSLLAGIDLHDGHIIGVVRERHRSAEFIEFLNAVDQHYPDDWKIRIILDNHSAHTSKETMDWLKQRPQRFEFVFTPKHASWLNIVESFFSKMTRTFLRWLRVNSKEELKNRIELFLEELNAEPVVFRWKYKVKDEDVQV